MKNISAGWCVDLALAYSLKAGFTLMLLAVSVEREALVLVGISLLVAPMRWLLVLLELSLISGSPFISLQLPAFVLRWLLLLVPLG